MSKIRPKGTGVAIGVLLAVCATSAQSAKPPARALAPNDTVATVGPVSITLAQVDEVALQARTGGFAGLTLGQALYDARRTALNDIVADMLIDQEAKARGIDGAKLTEQEVDAKVMAVTDADILEWYQVNAARVQGAPLDQVRERIRPLIVQQRTQTAYRAYVDQLKSKTTVRILLDPPRLKVATGNSPAKGPANAPIELVEFSDFQCPFCLNARPTVKKVLDTYGDQIKLVHRHFPLPNHPNAWPAAEASECAAEQGQFWPYHERLFAHPTKLTDGDLKQAAAELGMNSGRFNDCVDSHKYKAKVDADIKAGTEAGINGTPAFFINGRLLSGAQPFDAFKRIIDDELDLKKR
jgi:protein-disulfide isomerase